MVLQSLKNENIEGALAVWAVEHGYADYHSECRRMWKKGIDPSDDLVHKKNVIDVALTAQRYKELWAWLGTQPRQLQDYYCNYQRDCIRLAGEIQLNGLNISPDVFEAWDRLARRIKYRHSRIRTYAGVPRDVNANGDIFRRELFFEKMGLESKIETKKSGPALSRDHLELLLDQVNQKSPKGRVIRMYYDLTFIDQQRKLLTSLLKHVPEDGGLVHPMYSLGGRGANDEEGKPVVTGRWSASQPPAQQWDEFIKQFVLSRWEEGLLVNGDGSQIEPRTAYLYSEDPMLLKMFTEEDDPYLRAYEVLKNLLPGLEFRFLGKRGLLTYMYGGDEHTIEKNFNRDLRNAGYSIRITLKEAKEICKKLRSLIPRHTEWMDDWWSDVRKSCESPSLAGRVRHIADARSSSWKVRRRARNMAINAPIQSLASDFNTVAALVLGFQGRGWLLATMVHDSMVADARNRKVASSLVRKMHDIWNNLEQHTLQYLGVGLKGMPMKIKTEVGTHWHPMVVVPPDGDLEGVA